MDRVLCAKAQFLCMRQRLRQRGQHFLGREKSSMSHGVVIRAEADEVVEFVGPAVGLVSDMVGVDEQVKPTDSTSEAVTDFCSTLARVASQYGPACNAAPSPFLCARRRAVHIAPLEARRPRVKKRSTDAARDLDLRVVRVVGAKVVPAEFIAARGRAKRPVCHRLCGSRERAYALLALNLDARLAKPSGVMPGHKPLRPACAFWQ